MAAPIMNAGSDVVLNYSAISGGPTSQGLTGNATVTSPGSTISTWLWELVEKPTGSSASLSSTSAQNPTLNNIDAVGTYRLFLRGTDDAAQDSESDILKAPSSAFCTIAVRSQYAGLRKPAPGQRNWHDEYWEMIDVVDTLQDDFDTHASDTTDPHNTLSNNGSVAVSNAPSGSGEVLMSTSTTAASWQTAASGLVSTAETGVLGKVKLAEAPFDAANPKAVVKDKIALTAQVSGTLTANGWVPFEVSVPAAVYGASGTPSPYCAVFYLPYNMYITTVQFMFADGGSGTSYRLYAYEATSANYLANTASTALGNVLIASNSGNPTVGSITVNANVTAGNYVCVRVDSAPTTPGGGLTVQVNGYQVF